jgi:Smg protein
MNTKENTLDVLFYLFENYSDVDDVTQNKAALHHYLKDAGFPNNDISKAFDWLESLADETEVYITEPSSRGIRVFSRYESRWLNIECQSYLMFLEQSKVLTHEMRERAIDRILELKDKDFDVNRLKWVVLMLLLNQPDSEASYIWMDSVAMGNEPLSYH